MIIDLYDVEEFIKVNDLKEVTDPMLFIRGSVPTPGGLISTEIFGVSVKERKRTFAYISLNDYYLNPFIYKLLKRMNKNFSHLVNGTKKFVITNGQLVVDEEKGQTGIQFLYDNWEKLNFEKNNSMMRGERIDVLKAYKKNVIFTKYWVVIPAFYRDVNFQNTSKGKAPSRDELNEKYTKLIRLCSITKNTNTFDFVLETTKASIQEQLVDIYDFIKGKIERKEGLIRKNLLGRSEDYGSRSVISAPTFHAERPEDMRVDFYHTGVPLAQCCSLFTPFIVAWVKNFFRREFEQTGNKYPVRKTDGSLEFVELDDPEYYFSEDKIKQELNNFVHSFSNRFIPIELPVKNNKTNKKLYFAFTGKVYSKTDPDSQSNIIDRPATWCDLFYQAAEEVCADKMVYVTRYPILDYFGSFPSQITVLSTVDTMPVYINGRVYEHYPVIDLDKNPDEVAISFTDTVTMSNVYLKGLGGDYDGDQVSIKGLFTQEANKEAYDRMMSKANILDINANNMRTTTNEGIQTLYEFTKF